jgi:hypothetical protein
MSEYLLVTAWVWHLMGTMLKISVVQMKNDTVTTIFYGTHVEHIVARKHIMLFKFTTNHWQMLRNVTKIGTVCLDVNAYWVISYHNVTMSLFGKWPVNPIIY